MSKATEFVKALQARTHRGVQTVEDYRTRQKEEWLADLADLRSSIRAWLGPVLEAHVATVDDRDFPLNEPDLGSYTAPGLEVGLLVADQTRSVMIRPRGMRIVGVVETGGTRLIGARGRVDIECGVEREILLRFRDDEVTQWVSFSKGEKKALDEELFFALLARTSGIALV